MSVKLPSLYQEFIHLSRYSRWIPEKKRRETWEETVARYFDFFTEHLKERCGYDLTANQRKELETAVLNLEVMPSMRCLMTSGPALKTSEIAGYNCSYIAIDSPRCFDEMLFVLTNGTGVGFSVERQYVNLLPVIAEEFHDTDTTIVVADSKIGWAKALRELIYLLYSGQVPKWDISKVRPAGARLKTFGGRASGPGALVELFKFCIKIFKNAAGRKLTSLECHDICCKIANCIVVGGVRRSALISLSNLSDDRMRSAKSGQWWTDEPQRGLANNSAVYSDKPDMEIFIKEWLSLIQSKSGERGIFNRYAANKLIPERRKEKLNNIPYEFGANPCTEILLKNKQCCNLSEIVVRDTDTRETLINKAKLAAIFGTIQSTLDDFKYLSSSWMKNTKEERLLGVSLTGILDNPITHSDSEETKQFLRALRQTVIETNQKWAKKLGIEESLATTCTKPSGTVSQLVNSASGIHSRFSPYYIRTVRADSKDPLAKLLIDSGFPYEQDYMFPTNYVFSFPVKSPENSVYRNDYNAVQQLELWKRIKENWAEHTVSITVFVKEHEWLDVAAWVYKNFDAVTGISFLPYSDHNYQQAPYQEITKEEYEAWLLKMPKEIDWSLLSKYELDDCTTSTRELSCSSGSCELI